MQQVENINSNDNFTMHVTPDISIVIPVYFNAKSLVKLFDELYNKVIIKNEDKSFEVIFVDDGSKDDSFDVLLSLKSEFPQLIKLIKLTRNFGQGAAMTAGFQFANGNFILTIDADLQDPPYLINEMIDAFFLEGFQVVAAMREGRKESLYRKIGSSILYRIVQKLTFPEFPKKGFNVYGISKNANKVFLDNILNGTPISNVLIVWLGYPVKYIHYQREKREEGKSKFHIGKKIKTIFDLLASFSFLPIRILTIFGGIIAFLGFSYAGLIVYAKLFWGHVPFEGWAPIMVTILVIGGFQMIMIGVIGEYLWRTLDITRKRSLFIVEKIIK
jgi:glycosyltransferase involved in cell wall biosynthesis